jgi:F-type H+-transporting ATPase subunit b
MPQFDFAHVFWPQLFWLAIVFSILFFGVVLPTLPKLGRVMTEREDRVSGDLASAETAKAEADTVGETNEAGLAAARNEARAQLIAAKAKAARSVEKKIGTATAKLEEKSAIAQAELAKARKKAMAQVDGIAAESASMIVEKLTGKRPTSAAVAKATKAAAAQG